MTIAIEKALAKLDEAATEIRLALERPIQLEELSDVQLSRSLRNIEMITGMSRTDEVFFAAAQARLIGSKHPDAKNYSNLLEQLKESGRALPSRNFPSLSH